MLWAVLGGGVGSFYELLFLLLGYIVLLGVMMPVHEAAHAWAAVKLGDATPKWHGRLTLNPLAHFDPVGSLMILLFGIGYAKPVPVNPYNFRNRRRDMALTALAGPLSNIAMAIISIALFRVLLFVSGEGLQVSGGMIYYTEDIVLYAYTVLIGVFARVNLSLAVFNLLPLPPLDGSRIFGALLPERFTYWMDQYHQYVRMALLLLIVTGALDIPLDFLIRLVGNAACFLFRLPNLF
ncbi:MAG: site-2 protease family protein [Ruminococcaceae bacterium]|nr:site-2 protease family protein [Oscillospiraceae bacterium]